MRSINLGVRIKQDTTLTVELPFVDADAVVRIARGDRSQFQRFASSDGLTYEIPLTAGDYVLVVDSTKRPSATAPFRVTTSVAVAFWSAVHPAPAKAPRPWNMTIGQLVVVTDPKDPWPLPPIVAPTPDEVSLSGFLTSSSPITRTMSQLLDASTAKGAETGGRAPKTYALLVGIDKYDDGVGQDGAIYRDLRGCVHDILEVEKLLRSRVPGIEITTMLAPRPGGPGSDRAIPPDCVPTYANIVAAWQKVTATAQPGDIVYIHYSGHGGRAATKFPDYKPAGIDESLAPCDINDRDHGRYLRDVEIAALLQRMARRELLTTVVLDSCHSGSATRGDQAQARRGDREDRAPRGSDTLASAVEGTPEDLAAVARQLADSPFGPDATWRIDAKLGREMSFNTVIAACRQHEAAYEYSPDGNTRCGALTYFWLQALAQRSGATTYRRIYDQVFGNVHNLFASQTPLLLGEQNRLVLGGAVVDEPPSVPVRKVTGDEVELGIGAPVVELGMHLAIVPPDQLSELVDLSNMVEVEVIAVDGASSTARRVAGTGIDRTAGIAAEIEIGARGVVRSYPPRMQRAVRLRMQSQPPTEAFDRLAAKIADDPTKLLVVTADHGSDYQVLVDQTYRICDATGAALPYVPAIAITDNQAAEKVVDQLVHLARYDNALGLANREPSAPLAGKLEVEVLGLPGYDPNAPGRCSPVPMPPGLLRIQHGSYFCLRVRNRSTQYLQIAIIDLQPDWAIDTLTPDAAELAPGEERDLPFQATLSDPAYPTGRDVLKVLATRQPVDAALLRLPALGKAYVPNGPRGASEPALDELLRILQEPLTGQRKVAFARTPSSGWTVVQAELEIYREPIVPPVVRT